MEKEINFNEFGKTSYNDWKKQAESTLKGASFEKKLISKTIEKIDIQPLYQPQISDKYLMGMNEYPGFGSFIRGNSPGGYKGQMWLISQELPYSTAEEFNKKLINAINNGLEAVNLNINNPDSGFFIRTNEDFESCFVNIDLSKLYLIIQISQGSESLLQLINNYCIKNNIPTEAIKGSILIDPIRNLSAHGSLQDSYQNIFVGLSKSLSDYCKILPNIKLIGVDSTIFHNAGASAVQELAISIACGTEYLRQLIGHGHKPEDILNYFHFTTSVSSNFFMEISKIKAHRHLWSAITNEFGVTSGKSGSFIEAQNSLINKSSLDKHTNILRSTGETMASILGGADIISSFHFDKLDNGGTEFGERISRNIQLVLRHEAHLLDTIDPAGGTWFIDELVIEISQKAWSLFQEIESRGGILKALKDGYIQEMLSTSLASRISSYHTRKDALIGVNVFANTLENIQQNHLSSGKTISKSETKGADDIVPIQPFRFAEDFEELRHQVFQKSESNNEPGVFLANFGKVSEFASRMDFSSDFFRIGGFSIISSNQFEVGKDGIEQAIRDFNESGCKAMVICSNDANYPSFVDELALGFKKQNPQAMIILAGYPEQFAEQFRTSGIDEFIHVKSDILAQLKKVLNRY